MDYFKECERLQKEFLENPIERLRILKEKYEETETNRLQMLEKYPSMLLLHVNITQEYADLITALWLAKKIHGSMFKNDVQGFVIAQRMDEMEEKVGNYKEKKNPKATEAIGLSRAYATSLELVWKKLRDIVYLAGENPNKNFLGETTLYQKFVLFEQKYRIKLQTIKSFIDTELRNSVNHESTYFESPNIVVFLDINGKEIVRHTTEKLFGLWLKATAVLGAIIYIETGALLLVVRTEKTK